MSQPVPIQDLQVGMFVHLDLGWWAHPFALSSFLITSPEQIITIRRLGLHQLRWSPEKSRLADAPQLQQAAGDAPGAETDPAAAAAELTRAVRPAARPAWRPAVRPAGRPGCRTPAM